MNQKLVATAFASALLLPALASADDTEFPRVTFSGFGTLSAVSTDTDKAQYIIHQLQGSGAKKKVDFGVDSVLAGQANVMFSKSLSFVGQVMSNRTADDDFKPHIEWAFTKYAITPDLNVRAGIMALPLFAASDTRLLGFSNIGVRPATALYSQISITNFRGVDLLYFHTVRDVNFTLQPYYGKSPTKIPDYALGGHHVADIDKIAGLNLTAETGPFWSARIAYMQSASFSYTSPQLDQVFAGIRSVDRFVPGAAALVDDLIIDKKKLQFLALGLTYDGAKVFFQGEYGKRKTDFFLSDTSSWYTTFGYRFGNAMPYVTLSQVKVDSPTSSTLIPAAGPLLPLALGLNGLLATQNYAQKTVAIGARYQFMKNAVVKAQWDRLRLPTGAIGNFSQADPDFAGSTVNVYSVALDFVF